MTPAQKLYYLTEAELEKLRRKDGRGSFDEDSVNRMAFELGYYEQQYGRMKGTDYVKPRS